MKVAIIVAVLVLATLADGRRGRGKKDTKPKAAALEQGACYEETNPRLLPGKAGKWQAWMKDEDGKLNNSPAACKKFCEGFKYYGVQAKNQCFCGNKFHGALKKMPESQCRDACPGDAKQKCGAGGRMNIYEILPVIEQGACYEETNPRLLPGKAGKWQAWMKDEDGKLNNSPAACKKFCDGFKYYGVQAKNQCFCGDKLHGDLKKMPESQCKDICPGDAKQTCGAGGRMNLFDAFPAIEQGACYEETNPRLLPGKAGKWEAWMKDEDGKHNNSPAACKKFCEGFKYYGVQAKNQCFCGDKLHGALKKMPESQCKDICPGDAKQTCGAGGRMNLYDAFPNLKKAPAKKSTDIVNGGCYEDKRKRMLTGKVSWNLPKNTPSACKTFCKGFKYYAVQSKKECFCGDKLHHSVKKPEKECRAECPGDKSQKCGAQWRSNLYKNAAKSDLEQGACYEETNPRLLPGKAGKWEAWMKDADGKLNNSPAACKKFCEGFKYYGVQAKNQCFCGNKFHGALKKMPESQCKDICPGDASKKCGAGGRMNVYKTSA